MIILDVAPVLSEGRAHNSCHSDQVMNKGPEEVTPI